MPFLTSLKSLITFTERSRRPFLSKEWHATIALSHKRVVYSLHVVPGSLSVIRFPLFHELRGDLAKQQAGNFNIVFEATV